MELMNVKSITEALQILKPPNKLSNIFGLLSFDKFLNLIFQIEYCFLYTIIKTLCKRCCIKYVKLSFFLQRRMLTISKLFQVTIC